MSGGDGLPNLGEHGRLSELVAAACDASGLAVVLTLSESDPPRNFYLNPGAEKLLGYGLAEFRAMSAFDWIAPDALPRLRALRERYLRGEAIPDPLETTVIGRSGERIDVEVKQSRTRIEGQLVNVAFLFDISARKRSELALRQSEERFRTLIEGAPDGVAILTGGLRIAFLNGEAARMLGIEDPEAAIGFPVTDFLHPDETAVATQRVEHLLHGGDRHPESAEYRSRARDGREVALEVSSIPTEYHGEPAVLSFARDITERKAIQNRLVEADRLSALGVLSAGIAHEINNPLAYLLLSLEYLRRELPSLPEQPHRLEALLTRVNDAFHGAERVASIVRDLRTFARADEGMRGAVDVKAALEAALNIASSEIKMKAELIRDYEPVPAVEANPNRIEQVLLNLLVNAAQALPATETPGQRIVVSLRARDGLVEIAIADTGCGIPEAHLARIFEPFFTTKPVGVGTGLGLPICRSIIRGLGGEISVRSVIGQGSTFTVTLPASTAALPEPVAKARFSSIPPARRGNVLVVDDELSVARTLRALLGSEHELTLAASGTEALHALANEAIPEFDVILCDLMMPGMSGMDLYERIRQLYPGLEQRMVFMTGGVSLDRAREFLATITNLTFEKPFDFDELRRTLRRLVEAR